MTSIKQKNTNIPYSSTEYTTQIIFKKTEGVRIFFHRFIVNHIRPCMSCLGGSFKNDLD